ncbi:hypothetical protein [Lysinibacillus sp.]|uniref:hypothetical protein n=1 Tax=Lysinibacillus sp. TaxID=1869345 RepID=UPI0028AB9B52|nr:hypothetical protein [Lysinibacillus sp.]
MNFFVEVLCTKCEKTYKTVGSTNKGFKGYATEKDVIPHRIEVGYPETLDDKEVDVKVYSYCPHCEEENINTIKKPLN